MVYSQGIFNTRVPIIKIVAFDITVDILYANTNESDILSITHTTDESSLISLMGYKNNDLTLQLIPDLERFTTLLRFVKA